MLLSNKILLLLLLLLLDPYIDVEFYVTNFNYEDREKEMDSYQSDNSKPWP